MTSSSFRGVLAVASVLAVPVLALAQGNAANAPGQSGASPASPSATGAANAAPNSAAAKSAADLAWDGVLALRRNVAVLPASPASSTSTSTSPSTPPVAAGRKTPQQLADEQRAKAMNFRAVAAAARDFHGKYPTHAQAPAAKKLEALAGLEGILASDPAHEQSALAVAGAFRTNKAHPIEDRYEVAHSVERHGVTKRLGGKHWLSSPAESETLADRLHVEFGHLPQVYGNYLSIAEHTHCDHSRELANRILTMPAPASVKAAAQKLAARGALIRQPLDFPLTTDKGVKTSLSQLSGRFTAVVFYDAARSPAGPPGLSDYRTPGKAGVPGISWVYVAVGTPAALPKGKKALLVPSGTTCVEPLGMKGPVAVQLKLSQLPYVFVLDEQKRLSGYGRPDEIPALMKGTTRLLEP